MTTWIVALVALLPFADISVADRGAAPAADCLGAVRRALAGEYPHDDGDEHFCALEKGRLFCGAACTDRNCHNDGCDAYTAIIAVHVAGTRRHPVVRIDADLPADERRARRAFDRCLGQ